METFFGTVHLPGAATAWNIEVSIDWLKKEVYIKIPEAPSHIKEWSGVFVQTLQKEEAAFRTKGLPGAVAHWWHLFRNLQGGLFGLILALPDKKGIWTQCSFTLDKGSLPD